MGFSFTCSCALIQRGIDNMKNRCVNYARLGLTNIVAMRPHITRDGLASFPLAQLSTRYPLRYSRDTSIKMNQTKALRTVTSP